MKKLIKVTLMSLLAVSALTAGSFGYKNICEIKKDTAQKVNLCKKYSMDGINFRDTILVDGNAQSMAVLSGYINATISKCSSLNQSALKV